METEALAAPENTENPELENIKRKMQFSGTVIKTTIAGAVVDIGLSTPGVVHISQLSTDPVNRVEDVVTTGQQVEVWVKRVFPKKNRVELTMIRPLELEWREIVKGMNVKGKVTRLEKFGVFVDVGAERPGLVHISEMTHGYIKSPGEMVKEGDEIEVQVLNVNRQKKQIKLSMKALEEKPEKVVKEVQAQPSRPAVQAEEAPKEEAIPTAMEMALREAMERSKSREPAAPVSRSKQKAPAANNEIEQILARTLKNKAKTR
ncbi:MAG TPA: S1 RNA-binding domain-containing protein [Anaerolineales bacterium]|nr:S1 RNA-binding domain-containing protein [Anaerolineales bacterium]